MSSGYCPEPPAGPSESSPSDRGGFLSDNLRAIAGFPAAVRRGSGRRGAQPFRARRAAAVLATVLACGALLAPAPAEAQAQTVWSATLTADFFRHGAMEWSAGCSTESAVDECSTALSANGFTYDGTAYTVTTVQIDTINSGTTWGLTFRVQGKPFPKPLSTLGVLTVDGAALPFSDGTLHPDSITQVFSEGTIPFSWTQGQRVRVTLTAPPPLTAPANLRATAPVREQLNLTWSAVPGAASYKVQYRLAGYGTFQGTPGSMRVEPDPWLDGPTVTRPSATLTGLDGRTPRGHGGGDGESYEVRVQARNAPDYDDGPWAAGCFVTRYDAHGLSGGGESCYGHSGTGGGGGVSQVQGGGGGGGGGVSQVQGGGGAQGQQAPVDNSPEGAPRGRPVPDAAVNVNPGALRVAPVDDPATADDERRATYHVVLTRAPTGTVTLTPTSSDTTIATVTGALTFTTENWKAAQALTVTGMTDGRVGIAHSITGGGYDTVPVPKVTVVVGDGGGDARKTQRRTLGRASKRDAPDESPDITHAPPGALAALARGHLAGLQAALAPRLDASKADTSHLTLAGHTLALDESLLSGLSAAALDWDALPHPHGLSWAEATGRCASWTTAACGEADTIGITGVNTGPDPSRHGQPAGPWDGLLYSLATGLAGGGLGHSLWRDSGFVLTLGGDSDTGPGRRWTLWGQHRVQAVANLPAGTHYESELRSGWLGLDTGLGQHGRMGLALSRTGGQAPLRAVHPYLTWSDGRTTVSALGGFGKSVDSDRRWHTATEPDSPVHASANTPVNALAHAPLGLRMGLVEVQRTLGVFGPLQLGLRADAAWASLSAGDGSTVQTETVRRLRAGLDVTGSAWQGMAGLTLTPSLQAHLRSDTGDGTTGRGLELAGGLHAAYGQARLTVQGRLLTARGEATTRERGIESTLSLGQPGSLGPSFSLSARWGDAAVGGDTLWQERLHYYHDAVHTLNNVWSLDARSEVGLILPGGVRLTGFTSLSHDAWGPRLLFGLQRGHPGAAR